MTGRPRHPDIRALGVLLAALLALSGCSGNSTDLRLDAITEDASVRTTFQVRAYVPTDQNTADVYFSDIPTERLLDPQDTLADAVGSIVHLHMFLTPVAGATPIDSTACNTTVRQIVLAGPLGAARNRPALGVYSGGGFLLPDDSLFDATLKLTHASPGFVDRLGASRMHGDFAARREDELARAIAARFSSLLELTRPVPEAPPPAGFEPAPEEPAE
jgi:hypothetical protein